MRMLRRLAGVVAAVQLIAGCSVYMAAKGSEEPDLGVIKLGSARNEVELQLGTPIKSAFLNDGGRQDIYEYEIGNEPSAGRAVGHAAMDVLTLGVWELVGTPIEGATGEKYRLTITYDEDDLVEDLKSIKAE